MVGACPYPSPLLLPDSLAPLGFILPSRFPLNFFVMLGLSWLPPYYAEEKSEGQRGHLLWACLSLLCTP